MNRDCWQDFLADTPAGGGSRGSDCSCCQSWTRPHLQPSPSTQKVAQVILRQSDALRNGAGPACGVGTEAGEVGGMRELWKLWVCLAGAVIGWIRAYWVIVWFLLRIFLFWLLLLAINLLLLVLYQYPTVYLAYPLPRTLFAARPTCARKPNCQILL